MSKYRVIITECVRYEMEVEAEDENEARDLAEEIFVQSPDINQWCTGVDERDFDVEEKK
jgi:hypothetical protein